MWGILRVSGDDTVCDMASGIHNSATTSGLIVWSH